MSIIQKRIHALFNPEVFHGWGRNKRYFEGWYFKLINHSESHAFAIIPGIAREKDGNGHSFIQVLDGKKETATYHKFPLEAFTCHERKFEVRIENNFFSKEKIELDLPSLKGSLTFSNLHPWSNQWYSPGIMGPFAFIPILECYHGIVSMDHYINGQLTHNGEEVLFDQGKGYLEKDWGTSFPSAYIWMQSNHFSKEGISFKCSVAKIPWLGTSFTGFIAGLLLDGKLYEFTTYNFTKLKKSFADQETVEIILENRKYRLQVIANRSHATSLASPIQGLMDGRIEESMTATLKVTLTDKVSQNVLFNDQGRNAGLEVAGKIEEIMV